MTRPGGVWRNWGRTVAVRPARVERPRMVDAVRRSVRAAAARGLSVKAVGAGHSFSAIAEAPGVLLDMGEFEGIVRIDRERGRATFRAGTPLHRIPALLAPAGLAMANLGDIDRQTLAGAISTGTHGTGARFGGLSTQVVGVTMVTADGEVRTIDEAHDAGLLPAVALGLGALGILVEVTLQCVPAFLLRAVEAQEPLDAVVDAIEARLAGAEHVEFYWFPHTDVALTKTNTRLPLSAGRSPLPPMTKWIDETVLANGVYRATCALGSIVPAVTPPVSRLAARLTGHRSYTDLSHRVFTQRRTVRFREMEYAVPLADLGRALTAVRHAIEDHGFTVSFPLEVRVAAADDLWLSTAHGRPTGYIAAHRYAGDRHDDYFAVVEEIMQRFDGRPHWGKMHTQDAAALASRYPRFAEFTALRDHLDPSRTFANPYLRRVLGE